MSEHMVTVVLVGATWQAECEICDWRGHLQRFYDAALDDGDEHRSMRGSETPVKEHSK